MKIAVPVAGIVALLLPGLALAHSFGRIYNLPVPFWMYAYGAAAALVLSFVMVGYFVTMASVAKPVSGGDLSRTAWVRALRRARVMSVLRAMSVLLLLLCIATGFFGNRNPYANFSMTFFWIVFILGFAYLTALIGDLYGAINPWHVMVETIDRGITGFTCGRVAYPQRCGYWPALIFYMGFIWIELFGQIKPYSLAVMLLGYSALNFFGVWLIGSAAWFRYCEFLSVFFRLTARMAPLAYARGELRWRAPFVGLLEQRAESISLLVFVLFMLSSTAFDGLRATVPWINLFWGDPFNLIKPWAGANPVYAYSILRPVYLAYESLSLMLSPFIYLAVYVFFIALTQRITRSPLSLRELALRFGFSLLPIALVYNITHYYTLILTQGLKIVSLMSDPFGWGWNLFGTVHLFRTPILPDMGWVWHSQVALILLGHMISVYLAHVEALRTFPTRRQAALSQLPMLILMVLFTTAGLWILAQPIKAGG